jgi:hypothetical protein
MSKKQSSRSQKRSFPWLLLVLGGVLLLVAGALYFVNRGGGNGDGTPDIAVDPESIDYGDQALGTSLTFEIKVTNRGDALRFRKSHIEIVEWLLTASADHRFDGLQPGSPPPSSPRSS